MDYLSFSILLACVLAIATSGVSGLSCFQCNSHLEPDCDNIIGNDTSSPYYKPCLYTDDSLGKQLFCRKTVQIIMDRGGLRRVVRSCGWVKQSTYDCYFIRNKGHEDVSCQCFTDGCNSATVTTPSILFLLGLSIFVPSYFIC